MRRSLLLPILICLVGACVLVVAGCGGEETVAPTAETVAGGDTSGGDTSGGDTGGETTDTGGGETTDTGGEAGGEGDAEKGESIFVEQGCGGCHTLEAAGTSGAIGPNLDESKPDFELVVDRVTNGSGAMPSFSDKLSEDEINDVSAYVVESTQ
jgi:mono/diheme cytochrome c family protein